MSEQTDRMIVGALELCELPELGLQELEVRVDTGAKTSSLHVDNMRRFKKDGKPWIRFDIHPNIHRVEEVVECEARIEDIRKIKSSNGVSQERYVIKTPIAMGGQTWKIEITLTDRSDMNYLMLFGREGMGDKVLVDPSSVFLLSN